MELKSPFFLGHARAVSELGAEAGARLGLPASEVRTLRRAGLVHGLGRLGISNAIWDKPGPLGAGEWERVRLQPYLAERMLSQSEALAPLGRPAVSLRERPDGSGCPRGLSGAALPRAARVLGAAEAAGHRVPRRRSGSPGLTPREFEVLCLVTRGLSNKQIAERLVIAPKTVGNHVEHVYSKIGTSTRAAASLFAVQHGLLPEEQFPDS